MSTKVGRLLARRTRHRSTPSPPVPPPAAKRTPDRTTTSPRHLRGNCFASYARAPASATRLAPKVSAGGAPGRRRSPLDAPPRAEHVRRLGADAFGLLPRGDDPQVAQPRP